jgi:membrane-bound lytic murein transglycosylase B
LIQGKATAQKPQTGPNLADVPECWKPLARRLIKDGLDEEYVRSMLIALGPDFPQLPMGTKIKELYTYKYQRKAPDPNAPKQAPSTTRVYKGVPTQQNANLCRTFLNEHAAAFRRAEAAYGVPPSIAAALLFVESRLGKQAGRQGALRNLAGMAASVTPEHVPDYLSKLPGMNAERLKWLSGRVKEKSNWAYKELKALIAYAEALSCDPRSINGSLYGAIGLCQFMPTNIVHYAADGDADGLIDLHNPDDAIMSICSFLSKHGWKKTGMTEELRRKTLIRYNHSSRYANTILALSKLIGTGYPQVNPVTKK